MVFARRSTTLLAAIIASCAMVLSLTACTSDNKTVVDGQTTVTSILPAAWPCSHLRTALR